MGWNNTSLPPLIIDGIKELSLGMSSIVSQVTPITDAAIALMDTVSSFFDSGQDSYAAIFQLIIQELENLSDDLFNTGVSWIALIPNSVPFSDFTATTASELRSTNLLRDFYYYESNGNIIKTKIKLMTPRQAVNIVNESMLDVLDENRPIVSNSGAITSFGFMLTAPDLQKFMNLVYLFNKLFGIKEFEEWLEELTKETGVTPEEQPQAEQPKQLPQPPNWKSQKLSSISALKELHDLIDEFLGVLKGQATAAENAIQDLIDIIERKILQLQNLVEKINSYINELESASSLSGVYVFDYEATSGGIAGLQTSLSTGLDFANLDGNGFTVFALFVGVGPSITPVNTIKSLLL